MTIYLFNEFDQIQIYSLPAYSKKKKDAGFEIWTKVRIAYVYELYFVFLQDKLKFLNKD